MRYHPTRTRRLRLTRYPERRPRLSKPAQLLLAVGVTLAILFMLSYT
jgi:hypothetical protein